MELFVVLLAVIWLLQLRGVVRIDDAKRKNDVARDALNVWLDAHPDGASFAMPRAQQLIRERLDAWKAYVKVCPVLDDGGVLTHYLESCLEDPPERSAERPMP